MAALPWYRAGTVAVTNGSKTVSGTDTLWGGSVINPGDVLLGPDSKIYEVSSVSSNTSLTLSTPYLGATASAQSYGIVRVIPTGNIASGLASDLSALMQRYNVTLDQFASMLTGSGDVSLTNADGSLLTVPGWNKLQKAVGAKIAELDAWRAGARAEYGRFNLLHNSLFAADSNNDGIPDRYFIYTPAPAGTTFELITPVFASQGPLEGYPADRAQWTDGQIAAAMIVEGMGTMRGYAYKLPMRVLKVTVTAATGWNSTYGCALMQSSHHRAGLASRGAYVLARSAGVVRAINVDAPGPNGVSVTLDTNKVTKITSFGLSDAEGYGFIVSVFCTAPATFYIATPWVAEGYCDNWSAGIDVVASS